MPNDFQALYAQLLKATPAAKVRELAELLKLPEGAVRRMGPVWVGAEGCWAHPEIGPDGTICGIERRWPDGTKKGMPGGHRGLFVPIDFDPGPPPHAHTILIVEGASDTAAALAMGFIAVGRPSNRGGAAALAALLQGHRVLIVGENDKKKSGHWPGKEGAVWIADSLTEAWQTPVRWSLPPADCKDLRGFFHTHGKEGAAKLREHFRVFASELQTLQVSADQEAAKPRPPSPRPRAAPAPPAQPEPSWPALVELDTAPSGPPAELSELIPEPLGDLREYLISVADSIEVPVELPFMLALPALAAAISGKRELYCGGSWVEPPPLWTMTLLGPGNRKSAVFAEIIRPIREWERLAASEQAPELAKLAHQRDLKESRLKHLRTKIAAGKAHELDEDEATEIVAALSALTDPPACQLTTSEPTTEALAGLLARNGERALVTSAEADVLEVIMGRYNSGRGNYSVWLAGHAGDSVTIDRSGNKRTHLARPCVSIGLVPQPVAVRQVLSDQVATGRGFVARFLTCCPRDPIGTRALADRPIDEGGRRWWASLIQSLLDEPLPSPGERVRQYTLSPAARSVLHDFRVETERSMAPGGALSDRKDFGAKLPGAVARVALVYHAAQQAAASSHRGFVLADIDQQTMDAAIRFGEWASAHDQVAMGQAGTDPDRVVAEMVVRSLRKDGRPRQSRSQLYEAVRGRAGGPASSEALEPAITILLEHQLLREIQPPQGAPPRTPTHRHYAVHPKLLG